MSNGNNNWNVGFSRISWVQSLLQSHGNVLSVSRGNDIVFETERKSGDRLIVLCLDEYVMGISATQRVFREFSGVHIIYVGGNWNKYTREAKQYCLDRNVGLYNAGEINGALWRSDFWAYHKRDEDGNPVYPYGS